MWSTLASTRDSRRPADAIRSDFSEWESMAKYIRKQHPLASQHFEKMCVVSSLLYLSCCRLAPR